MAKSASENDKVSQVVLIVRHAHRNKKDGRELDNGLSEKGFVQAKKIRKYIEKKFSDRKPVIVSSPKRRCIETVEEIACRKSVEVKVSQLLDEGGDIEKKVEQFVLQLKGCKGSPLIICSHGDIIPNLLERMTHTSVDLSKGGMARIEKKEGSYSLQGILQEFDLR